MNTLINLWKKKCFQLKKTQKSWFLKEISCYIKYIKNYNSVKHITHFLQYIYWFNCKSQTDINNIH